MRDLSLDRAFTLIEPGPVVLVTTSDGVHPNVMTISWTMPLGFSAEIAITTGAGLLLLDMWRGRRRQEEPNASQPQ